MRRYYPAMWRTADQYVRTFNGIPCVPVIDTLSEAIVMHDPFQRTTIGHIRAMFVGTTLRINGF